MSEKDPLEHHGDAEEWGSYAPNCPPRLTKAALTQEQRLRFAEKQFHAENTKQKTSSRIFSGSVGALRLRFDCPAK